MEENNMKRKLNYIHFLRKNTKEIIASAEKIYTTYITAEFIFLNCYAYIRKHKTLYKYVYNI